MKLPPIISRRVGKARRKAREQVRTQPCDLADFVERFESCAPLREARTVLCLGARLGTEVKALRQLGYLAIGIDLSPGADNNDMPHGNFHDLAIRTGSFDAVYANALDHVFDPARILAEVRRVLKPSGLFVADLAYGSAEGGRYAGKLEAPWWQDSQAMIDRLAASGAFDLVETRELRTVRQALWRQAVLRRSASEVSSELIVLERAGRLDGGAERERRVAPAIVRGKHRRIAGRGRPSPRQGGRLRAAAVVASCLLVATVAGFFLLRGPTPTVDQPQRTWVTPPPT